MIKELLFSVIVPVYNAESTVARTIESLVSQMNENVEIILVDDGSTDRSISICDDYALKYMGIVKVFHKENGGVSTARNLGVQLAQGKYILFIDADDYLDADTLYSIREVINVENPDCIDFGWKYRSSSGSVTNNLHSITKNTLLDKDVIKDIILPPLLNLRYDPEHFVYDFSWGKVFRKEIIDEYDITFNEKRRVWEDRPFIIQYLKYCTSYYCMNRCFYNYSDTPDSLSRKYSMEFFDIILENFQLYIDWFGDCYEFDTTYVNGYWSRTIESMILRSLKEKDNSKEIKNNILKALGDEQVISFFVNRIPQSMFEKKVGKYIQERQPEKALGYYINKNRRSEMKSFVQNQINQMKRLVKEKVLIK